MNERPMTIADYRPIRRIADIAHRPPSDSPVRVWVEPAPTFVVVLWGVVAVVDRRMRGKR